MAQIFDDDLEKVQWEAKTFYLPFVIYLFIESWLNNHAKEAPEDGEDKYPEVALIPESRTDGRKSKKMDCSG